MPFSCEYTLIIHVTGVQCGISTNTYSTCSSNHPPCPPPPDPSQPLMSTVVFSNQLWLCKFSYRRDNVQHLSVSGLGKSLRQCRSVPWSWTAWVPVLDLLLPDCVRLRLSVTQICHTLVSFFFFPVLKGISCLVCCKVGIISVCCNHVTTGAKGIWKLTYLVLKCSFRPFVLIFSLFFRWLLQHHMVTQPAMIRRRVFWLIQSYLCRLAATVITLEVRIEQRIS